MFTKLFIALFTLANAHSTWYPHVKHGPRRFNPLTDEPPAIISWHIHIVYPLSKDSVAAALELRNRTAEHFKKFLGPECSRRFDDGRLCLIADHDLSTILREGPFVAGEWSMFVPNSYYSTIIPWMVQNRGNFSLLVHPNSGYEYEDHSIWASWTGMPWPLNLAPDIIGYPGEKSNEHGHFPGDPDNPICVPKDAACGTQQTGPTAVCCPELSCLPSEIDDMFRCSVSTRGIGRFIKQ